MLLELRLDLDGTKTAGSFGLVEEQRLDWVGGRNGAEMSWYLKCTRIGLVTTVD